MPVTMDSAKTNRRGRILSSAAGDADVAFWQRIEAALDERIAQSDSATEDSAIARKIKASLTRELDNEINFYAEKAFRIGEQERSWLTKNSIDRWADYLIYRYKFRNYPATRHASEFPPYVLIEPTSICNLRCVMCFQVDTTFTEKQYMGRMPWDLFTKAVDEVAENGCQAVTLASRGEPTLHPQLGEMLAYIRDKGILDLKVNTNATRLTEPLTRQIIEAGVSELVFSVDAGTKETYERIRVKGRFDRVVENIRRFKAIRDAEYPNAKTTTRIAGVKVDDDQDIDQMVTFWKQHVDEVSIKPATERWDSYNNEVNDLQTSCAQLWERIYVWYDGTLNPCDFDYKSFLSVGNLNDMTIKEAWRGEAYAKLREAHLEKQRSRCFPCDRCPL